MRIRLKGYRCELDKDHAILKIKGPRQVQVFSSDDIDIIFVFKNLIYKTNVVAIVFIICIQIYKVFYL